MNMKYGYCVFYVFLLMTITPAMCRVRAKAGQSEKRSEKRQFAAALLPALPSIAGTAVVPWLFAALVAVYGLAALREYAISEDWFEDKCYPQNTCANNRGHCREWGCWSWEYPIWWLSDVCGGGCPCCVVDYVYEEITGRRPPRA